MVTVEALLGVVVVAFGSGVGIGVLWGILIFHRYTFREGS